MALADILGALVGNQAGSMAPGVDPGQSTSNASQGSTPLSELLVQSQGKPKGGAPIMMAPPASQPTMSSQTPASNIIPPTLMGDQSPLSATQDYNNSNSVGAVNAQDQANMPTQVNSGNPGLYGILPKSLQHGVLRNTLGAIGDAFLVGGGKQPTYADSLGREAIGNAMAGVDYSDPASVQAAMQRIAATGAPGSIQDADSMQKNYNDLMLRKQMQEQTQWYHENMINSRQSNTLDQMWQRVGPTVSSITNPGDYAAMYQRLDAMAKRVDPSADPTTAWGLPPPDQWHPGMLNEAGSTAGQVQSSVDKGLQRQQSNTNNIRSTNAGVQEAGIRAGATVQSARIGAGSRSQPLDNQLYQQWVASQNGGAPLNPATAEAIDKRFGTPTNPHPSQGNVRSPYAGLPTPTGPGAAIGSSAGSALGAAMTSGRPQSNDISYLKAHPDANHRAAFDAHFGQGASSRILGR